MVSSSGASQKRQWVAPRVNRPSTHEPASDELGRGVVDPVGSSLGSDPVQQLAHTVLQAHLCLESQELLGAGRIGEAMPDVSHSIRRRELGRDVNVEPGR